MQALCCGSSPEERGNGTMAKTYRDVAIEQMIATVEEAMLLNGHSTDKYPKLTAGKALPDVCCDA
jgi:hypothetical protein